MDTKKSVYTQAILVWKICKLKPPEYAQINSLKESPSSQEKSEKK